MIQVSNTSRGDDNIKVAKHVLTMSLIEINELLEVANARKDDLTKKALRIGAVVKFGRPNGAKRTGTIEKINISKAIINVDFKRWSVPISMLEVINT